MPWLETTVPFTDELKFQGQFVVLTVGNLGQDVAIFRRNSDDRKAVVLLLSPDAAEFADLMPGKWITTDPREKQWTLLVGQDGVRERLGVST